MPIQDSALPSAIFTTRLYPRAVYISCKLVAVLSILRTYSIILDQLYIQVHTYIPAVAMPFKLCIKLILATTLLTAAKTTTKIFIIAHTCNVASYVRKCSMH